MRRQNFIRFDVKRCSGMESINLEGQSTHVGVTARRRSVVKYERTNRKIRVKKEDERRARGFSKLPVEPPMCSRQRPLCRAAKTVRKISGDSREPTICEITLATLQPPLRIAVESADFEIPRVIIFYSKLKIVEILLQNVT